MLDIVKKLGKLPDFLRLGGSRDHMSSDRSGQSALCESKPGRMSKAVADNSHKSISVIKTERCKTMTLATNFNGLTEGKFPFIILDPKDLGLLVTVGSRFVQCIASLAK